MDNVFRPKPGRFGTAPCTAATSAIGTPGIAATASATTSYYVDLPRRRVAILGISIMGGVPAAGGAAITFQVIKNDGTTDTALTAATSLTNSFITSATRGSYAVALSSNTDGAITIPSGYTIRVDVVAAGTITTQPGGLRVVVEYGFLE